jgi:resuscitation-promoting factor RpfB
MAVSPKGGIMKLTKRGIAVRNTAVILVGLFIWETIGGAVAAESPQPEVQVIVTEAKPKTIEFPLDAWSPATAKAYARFALEEYGWDEAQFECVHALWTRESNWRWKAKSPTSDYGIPQRHMSKNSQAQIKDFLSDPIEQISWGLGYIEHRYGSPCAAKNHSDRKGWY